MRIGICVVLSLAAVAAMASDPVFEGKKLETPPTIDGTVSDGEWAGIPSSDGAFDSMSGQPHANGLKFWLAYDDQAIYFAARMLEPNPNAIKASEYRTNVSLSGDDSIALAIDPFGRTGGYNVFAVNPRGATMIRIAGGRAAKREWLGEFVAKGRITEAGWEAEARIPWGVMRLPAPGPRELSFNVFRYDPRTQREYSWQYAPQSDEQFGRWTNVSVPASGNKRSLKLLPYIYGGYDEKDGHIANAGLDVKTSINDQIDVVGTINPDFRNIENQILSLDFSRFERIAGESRPFFLEGQEFFRTSGDTPLFLSQRIRKLDAGLKVFGKVGDNTRIAMFDAIDFGAENSFVANVQHQVDTKLSFTGAVATYDKDSIHNLGTHIGANYQLGQWFGFASNTFTKDSIVGDGRRYNAGFGYFGNGINSFIEYYHMSPDLLPRIGFAPERNFKGVTGNVEYVKPVPKGKIMEWGFEVGARDYTTIDGTPYRRGGGLGTSLTFRDGTDIDLGVEAEKFFNSYDYRYFASLERPRGDPRRRWQLDHVWGRVAGQDFQLTNGTLAYRPLEPLQLTLSVQHIKHFGSSTQSILGFNYDLTEDTSISGRAVRRDNETNFYVAWRKSGNRGAEYFVILGDPNAQKFRAALVVKASFPIELKF